MERGILGWSHDHPNTVSMMGASEPNRCIGSLDWLMVALSLTGLDSNKIVRKSS